MSPQELAAIVARHVESPGSPPDRGRVCLTCWQEWPCDANRLLALLRETREALDSYDDEVLWERGERPNPVSDPLIALLAALGPS